MSEENGSKPSDETPSAPTPDASAGPSLGQDAPARPERPAPVEHHFQVTDDGVRVEVGGKWYPVTSIQRLQLEEAGRRGASTATACERVGIEIDDAPDAE